MPEEEEEEVLCCFSRTMLPDEEVVRPAARCLRRPEEVAARVAVMAVRIISEVSLYEFH